MTVSQLQEGRAQIVYLLPDLNPDTLLSLRMTVRGSRELPLTLGIRQQNAPYEYLWSRSIALGTDWRELKWTFAAPKNAQAVMLILEVPDVGQLDIAGLKLRETSPTALSQQWQEQSVSPNLLRNSRLPLGTQSGWWFNQGLWNWWLDYGTPPLPADADSLAQIHADADVIGPSGAPTTRIDAPRGFGLYSAPFAVPLPFESHAASMWMKGSGRGVWIVWGDGRELARHDFDLKDEQWQRQQVTFTPDINIRVYALRWEGSGTFWLDGMQVESGAKATPFQAPAAAEIALSASASDDAPRNVQWDEDRSIINFAVLGDDAQQPNLEGAKLKSQVVSIEGDTKTLPDIALNGEFVQRGQLDFGVFPAQMLGVFRIEAWVEDARRQRISDVYEIVVNRLHKARYWKKDAPLSSPFGTHVLAITTDIQMAKAIGINWVRGHDIGMDYLGWFYLEPTPGQWKFRDTELHRYREQHLRILGMLQTAPAWASQLQKAHNPYWDMFYQPKDPAQFGNYVRTVAERYKGVIDAYEVWSEPWNFPWFAVSYDENAAGHAGGDAATPLAIAGYRTSAQPQKDYARLMQEAYSNAKAVAPEATILGFNTTTAPALAGTRMGGQEWTRGVLENGGLNEL